MITRIFGAVTGGRLNLRAAADSSASILASIPNETLLVVTEHNDTWYAATYGSHTGFVMKQYITLLNLTNATELPGEVTGGSLNMRRTASTSADRLIQIPNNTAITVIDFDTDSQWYITDYNGYTGYVMKQYVTVSQPVPNWAYGQVTSNALNVRRQPSTSAARWNNVWPLNRIALEYRCVRCLFCNTGKERQVVRLITEKGWGRAIFPQRIKKVLKNGVWTENVCPLMPGYVFVYSDEEEEPFAEFSRLNHVIRVLAYGDGSDVLTGRDLEFAAWIWGLNGRIAVMKAAQIGDRIEIIDGVFKQLHGTITRMDRRRKTIRVSVEMEETPKQIWLAYEIVEERAEETRDSQSKLDGWRFVPR